MKISILCSSDEHPIYPWLTAWTVRHADGHAVELVNRKHALSGGDLLLLISCNEVIDTIVRNRYRTTLLIHSSDLPEGRGWSPHIWQILEGRSCIKVTLLEAVDAVDSGAIWAQRDLVLEGHELFEEINRKLFAVELDLMDFAVANFGHVVPRPQDSGVSTYYMKRTREDSRLDPHKTLAEQFDLLRVADSGRFPAFFDFRGHRYYVQLNKEKDSSP